MGGAFEQGAHRMLPMRSPPGRSQLCDCQRSQHSAQAGLSSRSSRPVIFQRHIPW